MRLLTPLALLVALLAAQGASQSLPLDRCGLPGGFGTACRWVRPGRRSSHPPLRTPSPGCRRTVRLAVPRRICQLHYGALLRRRGRERGRVAHLQGRAKPLRPAGRQVLPG